MEIDIEFTENIAEGKKVDDKEKGPQDRALGHTCSDWGWSGFE